MKAAIKQKRLVMLGPLGQIYPSMIECPKHDWQSPFVRKSLCYSRATAGTFILNLLYFAEKRFKNLIFKETWKTDCGLNN